MNVHKFLYFTIQGDDLDLGKAQNLINLPCSIFRKGEIISKNLNGKLYEHTPQQTNRWLYCVEEVGEISPEDFLLDQLGILIEHLAELKNFIANGMATLELALYAGNETDFKLSPDHISQLNKLGLGIQISFC